jgi:hypothetical protein
VIGESNRGIVGWSKKAPASGTVPQPKRNGSHEMGEISDHWRMGEIHERRQKPWKHCVIVEVTEFLVGLAGRGKRT